MVEVSSVDGSWTCRTKMQSWWDRAPKLSEHFSSMLPLEKHVHIVPPRESDHFWFMDAQFFLVAGGFIGTKKVLTRKWSLKALECKVYYYCLFILYRWVVMHTRWVFIQAAPLEVIGMLDILNIAASCFIQLSKCPEHVWNLYHWPIIKIWVRFQFENCVKWFQLWSAD
jgi:hypothetical protein